MPSNGSTYTLYCDGGGTPSVPTYFSYRCLETEKKINGQIWNPISMQKFYLLNLPYEFLPQGCDIFNDAGYSTNNIAEYAALFYGLEKVKRHLGHVSLNVKSDSQLVVYQLLGRYACKYDYLQGWKRAILSLWWPQINLTWVPREEIVLILNH